MPLFSYPDVNDIMETTDFIAEQSCNKWWGEFEGDLPIPSLPDSMPDFFTFDNSRSYNEDVDEFKLEPRTSAQLVRDVRRVMTEYPQKDRCVAALKRSFSDEELHVPEVKKTVVAELGLLGGLYLSPADFDNCGMITSLMSRHRINPVVLQKMGKCNGCVYNRGGNCSLLGRRLAERHIIFNRDMLEKYLNDVSAQNKWLVEKLDLLRARKFGPRKLLQQAMLEILDRKNVNLSPDITTSYVGYDDDIINDEVEERDDSIIEVQNAGLKEDAVRVASEVNKSGDLRRIAKFALRIRDSKLRMRFVKEVKKHLSSICADNIECNDQRIIVPDELSIFKAAKCEVCPSYREGFCGKYNRNLVVRPLPKNVSPEGDAFLNIVRDANSV